MNDEVLRNAKGWLIFKGNVDPGWNNRNVQIYKRLCQGCEWTLVKKTRTDGSGRWRTRIYAPQTGYWFWKGLVPKTGGYGKSVTKTYRTYVSSPPSPRRPLPGWGLFVLPSRVDGDLRGLLGLAVLLALAVATVTAPDARR